LGGCQVQFAPDEQAQAKPVTALFASASLRVARITRGNTCVEVNTAPQVSAMSRSQGGISCATADVPGAQIWAIRLGREGGGVEAQEAQVRVVHMQRAPDADPARCDVAAELDASPADDGRGRAVRDGLDRGLEGNY
jgi:hypothetical protein